MTPDFPPRYLCGYVQRVNPDGTLCAMLGLGFGVHYSSRLTVEGLTLRGLARGPHDAAMHCLLVLIGGKDFYALVPHGDIAAPLARVFLEARIRDSGVPGLTHIPGVQNPVLEVAGFMAHLATHDFDVTLVKRALNGAP